MDSADIRRAAVDLNEAFVSDLAALTPWAWAQPCDCDGWSVAGAVIHLIQVADLLGGSLARGQAGDPGPPPEAVDGIQAWRAWRAGLLRQMVDLPPEEILERYRAGVAKLEREFDQIDSASTEARGWHPAGPQPLPWFIDQWLFELALHDWDIRVAADPTADLRPSCRAAFAESLPPRLVRGFGGADDPALAGRYRIELALGQPASKPFAWTIRVGDGRAEPEPDDSAAADVTIRSDPSAFGLVMTNRRPAEQFAAAGRWQTSGDDARAASFARAFRSY